MLSHLSGFRNIVSAVCLIVLLFLQSLSFNARAESGGSGDNSSVAYLDVTPAFVVNIDDPDSGIRFLMVAVSLQLGNASDLERVQRHMPMIKHKLVLLFSSLRFDEISSSKGKEEVAARALKEVQAALVNMTGRKMVEAVLLSSVVGQ